LIAYYDTSALVKLLIPEEGSQSARSARNRAQRHVSAAVTHVEAVAALRRLRRGGSIGLAQHRRAREDFADIWRHVIKIRIDDGLIARAVRLADERGLKGYDAVQLASALHVVALEPVMVSFDRELHAAARAAGLVTWPVTLG
jgi:predicted nucleic acid-binding protein